MKTTKMKTKLHKRPSIILLLVLLLATSQIAHAQFQDHIWYFGNSSSGGINFDNSTNQASPLNNHYTPFGAEGCFVATDPSTGELMFYTSGNTIINKNHVPMENGNLVFPAPAPVVQPGGGIFNSSVNGAQSVAVIEKPNAVATGECGKFLYFINDANEWGSSGKPGSIYVGEIDMNANSGLGAVTKQPVRIFTDSFTESMYVVARPDNQGAWLILNNVLTNSMEVYAVSAAGTVNTTPVSSYVIPGVNWAAGWPAFSNVAYWLIGSMAYHQKTGKFAMSMSYGEGYNLYISDFNSTTGAISGTTNPVRFGPATRFVAYSTEFSPSGKWLYFSVNSATDGTGAIRAYNMQTNTDIGNINGVGGAGWAGLLYNGLKAGPDGRLWVNTNNYGTDPTPARVVRSTFDIENPVVNGFENFPLSANTLSYRFPDFLSLVPAPLAANDVTPTLNCNTTSATVSVLTNDVNQAGGNLFLDQITQTPAHGTAAIVGNTIVYTLTDMSFTGTDIVKYIVKSDVSCFAPGTVSTLEIPVTQCPWGPFTCAPGSPAYIVHLAPAILYSYDPVTGTETAISSTPILSGSLNTAVDAIGYNAVDNYLWGSRMNTNEIVRIANDGSGTTFPVTGLPAGEYRSGDISPSGVLYLSEIGGSVSIYSIDLTTGPPYTATASPVTNTNIIYDWAYNPIDNKLYGVDSRNGDLYSYIPATGLHVQVGKTGLPINSSNYNPFFDNEGNLYFAGPNGTYRIDRVSPARYSVYKFSNGTAATDQSRDIASCRSTIPDIAQTPFDCSNEGIVIGGSVLYSFNMASGVMTPINSSVNAVNAIGYNVKDGYVWGVQYLTPETITRISSDGTLRDYTIPGLAPGTQGDISKDGIYYLATAANNKLLAVNLDPASPDYLTFSTVNLTGSIPTSLNIGGDFAISPIDGKIYQVGPDKGLYRIDPATGVSTFVGTVSALTAGNGYTAFMDDAGNFYVLDGTGQAWRIASPHTGGLVATKFSKGISYSVGDGTRCSNAQLGPVAGDDKLVITSCAATGINILTNDSPGSSDIVTASTTLLEPITNNPVMSVTLTGKGTFVLDPSTNVITFAPIAGFSGTATVDYQITDQNGLTDNATLSVTVSNCPLPVTLVSFKAKAQEKTANLTWETTAETNSDRFEIQRSLTGKDWNKIGTVVSHGESTVKNTYTFNDPSPANGENLYRLKMIDKDATFAYSHIQSVKFDGLNAPAVSLYPNPSRDKVFIQDADLSQIKQVSIIDMNGRSVYSSNTVTNSGINVSKLISGTYIIHITNINGSASSHKIVIVK